MKNKKLITVAMAVAASMLMTGTAMAGSWQKNENGWWYDNGNGTWPANTWQWIDGNGDGIAESYHFDKNGYLSVNTTVDGYPVNADGAWTVNGAVQTQATNSAPAQQVSDELTEAERQALIEKMYQIICKNSGVDRGYTVDLHVGLMDGAQKYAEDLSNQNWYQVDPLGYGSVWITDEVLSNKGHNEYDFGVYDAYCDVPSEKANGYNSVGFVGRTTGSPKDMWNEWIRMNTIWRAEFCKTIFGVDDHLGGDICLGDFTIGIGVVRKNDVYYWVILHSYGEPTRK